MSLFIPLTKDSTTSINTPYTGSSTQIISLTCWMMLPTLGPSGTWRDIVTIDPNIYCQIYSDGQSIDFGTFTTDHNGQVLQAGTWYHIGMVVVPTSAASRQIYGYVNGQLQVNVTDATTSVAYTNICVGNSIASSYVYPLNGNVADVRVWTRQLNQREIVDEMNSKVPIHRQAILLWSPFDDSLYPDFSGNNHVFTVGPAITLQSGSIKTYPKISTNMTW